MEKTECEPLDHKFEICFINRGIIRMDLEGGGYREWTDAAGVIYCEKCGKSREIATCSIPESVDVRMVEE